MDPESLNSPPGGVYEPPVRIYFATAELVKAGVAAVGPDGSVRAVAPLPTAGKAFIEAISASDIPAELQSGTWTPQHYLDCTNAVVQLHRAEALAGAFPLGAARREKKRSAKQAQASLRADTVTVDQALPASPPTGTAAQRDETTGPQAVGVWAGPLPVLVGLLLGVAAVWQFGVAGVFAPALLGVLSLGLGRSAPGTSAVVARAGVGAVFGVLIVALFLFAQVLFPQREA